MRILAIDCCGSSASCAVINDSLLEAQSFTNVKLTHSQTLLKMTADMLSSSKIDINDIDGFCVSAGPGSFTGVRIGISAIKGLSCANDKPCVTVSSLAAIAQTFTDSECIVCAVLDARCSQVYNALFRIKNGKVKRLCEDRAIKCEDLAKELAKKRTAVPIIIAGDGTEVFYPFAKHLKLVKKASITARYQSAAYVATLAYNSFLSGNTLKSKEVLPVYLRLPQAERELNAKRSNKK